MSLVRNTLRIGLVVNPVAGIGGPAGLKGSDHVELINRARKAGASLRSPERALRCLRLLSQHYLDNISFVTYPAQMGEEISCACGFATQVLTPSQPFDVSTTKASDTIEAVQGFIDVGVDLILFVGGDGTARDVCSVVAEKMPVLGIPAGVKMHSGVFALSPESAFEIIQKMILGQLVDLQAQEVRDIDEDALRQGVVNSRYFGDMQVPCDGEFVQQVKQGGIEVEELVLLDISAELIERLKPGTMYLVGAGTTPAAFMEQLHLPNTLLGTDVVCNDQLLHSDVNAPELERLLEDCHGDVIAILSITGHQGSLIGRGNQQLSPKVLRRIGKDGIWVVATKTKIKSLVGRPLLMDSNDVELDKEWQGFINVITGYHDTILYPLGLIASGVTK
jgi:predicted polyphosphate/ATP-dependent NAD kinase